MHRATSTYRPKNQNLYIDSTPTYSMDKSYDFWQDANNADRRLFDDRATESAMDGRGPRGW